MDVLVTYEDQEKTLPFQALAHLCLAETGWQRFD